MRRNDIKYLDNMQKVERDALGLKYDDNICLLLAILNTKDAEDAINALFKDLFDIEVTYEKLEELVESLVKNFGKDNTNNATSQNNYNRVLEVTNDMLNKARIQEGSGGVALYIVKNMCMSEVGDDTLFNTVFGKVLEIPIDDIYEGFGEAIDTIERTKKEEKALDNMESLTNLNEKVKKDDYNVVGMDEEVKELIRGILRFKKPNVIIKGKAGTGKTALVEKLADMINKGEVPDIIKDKKIYQLDITTTVAGTQYRGQFEEKINKILKYVKNRKDIILFIDEIHMMVKAGVNKDEAGGLGDILKPALSRGEICVIGATTTEEYDKYIACDQALQRRFKTIAVDEPTEDEVIKIINGAKGSYEKHYNVQLKDKDIKSIYTKAKDRFGAFPDKAFDELEEYCLDKIGV